MNDKPRAFWDIFFELYEPLPRQGPGSRESAAHALALVGGLPPAARIADFGCGAGGQTLHLAGLIPGSTIEAIDAHAPLIERLQHTISAQSLENRVHAQVADFTDPPFAPGSFDLIWCEGAIYNIGVARGLQRWRSLLRPHGCIAFTEAVWLRDDPPAEIRAMWAEEYSTMSDVAANLAIISRTGFDVIGHFTLPDADWWTDFYTPIESRIAVLREIHAANPDAQAILDLLAREPAMHRRSDGAYGYEFFVVRPAAV